MTSSDELLWTRYCNCRFHKERELLNQLKSAKRLCYVTSYTCKVLREWNHKVLGNTNYDYYNYSRHYYTVVCVTAGTHYPHVTWAHVRSRVKLGCDRRFNIEFYDADSHFCHSSYVTWSHVELWSAHTPARLSHFCRRTHFVRRDQRFERSALDTLVTPHEMCATTEMWKASWRVSRPELHVRSRDVSIVTEVWICVIEFNVKSPLTSQLHAWHHMSSRDVRIVCPRPYSTCPQGTVHGVRPGSLWNSEERNLNFLFDSAQRSCNWFTASKA